MKKNPFKDFFYFSKGDRRAIVALGCIAVFAIGVLMVVDRPSPQPSPSMERVTVRSVEYGTRSDKKEFVPHVFNPNTVDSLTLIGFGLKEWKVRNFLHYRAAGKVFRSAEEMGKTYGWTEEDVEKVRGYVRVEIMDGKNENYGKDRNGWERKEEHLNKASKKFQSLTKVDINTADTALLRRVPGVGAKISEAIVAYRKRLGGFYSVEQLREIRIVSPELLDWFDVSSSPNLQSINLNKASFQALNRHPYISYEQAKALLQYIRLYGKVKDEKALIETGIFTEEEVERLKPYLTFE